MQTLAGVGEHVGDCGVQQIELGHVPQAEHVVQDLAPEHKRLLDKVVLPLVVVREPCACVRVLDGEREPLLVRIGREEVLEELDDFDHGVAIAAQVRVVVRNRVDALADVFGLDARRRVLLDQGLDRPLLLLDLAVDLRARLALGKDLHRRGREPRVLQQSLRPQTHKLVVHALDLLEERDAEHLLHLGAERVLQHVDHLAVLCAHALGVHDLVAPSDLKYASQKLRHFLYLKAHCVDDLAPDVDVYARNEAVHDGCHRPALGLDALHGLHLCIHRRGVVRHTKRRAHQAERAALALGETHRNVLRPLEKPAPGVLRQEPDARRR
eukprot:Amastigsp_a341308_26.p2 type:complete len:325 gc:universal Amastigsp_a341308_26:491-1465(+)